MRDPADIDAFIAHWRETGGSELANTQSFINGLCHLLGVDAPAGSRTDDKHNDYVFERRVFQDNGDGTQSFGRIDCYKRRCFILEAKQGSEGDRAAAAKGEDDLDLFGQTASARVKRGTARRGTPGWAKAMVQAKGQAERYAKALPADHGWPPFLLVADIGYCIEVYADFTGTGKAYEVLQALPLAGSPAANEPLEVNGRNVYKALSQSTGQGRPLGWRTPGEVAKAIPEAQTRFYETVAKLAQLEADDHAELEECARALEALHEEGITALKRGEVLCITISIFGTRNPNSACWFKARTFDKLGKLLFGRRLFRSSRFELQDFEEFQGLLHRMRSMLGEWGWKPSNLRDVQGFIWVALSEAEESETKDGLTREAVERSMDECEQIGVEAFLAKYQFGKPRDYWVRRESGGMLYPAKATVGAAYGFLPDGKPQSAKEFYGGFGEQAANGILQRLGFEIVTVKGTDVAEPQDRKVSPPSKPTNLILYGPPGTGKTYATAAEAVKLCGEEVPDDRDELMAVYRRLTDAKRIEFVTFHQSMSYEDFVEGKQPVTGADSEDTTGGFRLETFPGIFRRIARRAETSISSSEGPGAIRVAGRQVFKTSIGEAANPEDAYLFEEAIAEGHTLLGFEDIDWSDDKYASRDAIIEACREHGDREGDLNAQTGRVQMPFIFRNWVKPGDLIIVSKGNSLFRAIGEVTGEYEFHPRPEGDYAHRRKVRWLWVDREGVPVSEIYQRKFSMRTIYEMTPAELNIPALERYINSQQPTTKAAAHPDQFVLIIDEINRANISKVFGELITLLEPDKRLGQPNEIKVRLPHSEDEFGVPSNLHIIGTMNTADRSIALLDTALRRRFEFREMMPKPEVLNDAATRTDRRQSAQAGRARIQLCRCLSRSRECSALAGRSARQNQRALEGSSGPREVPSRRSFPDNISRSPGRLLIALRDEYSVRTVYWPNDAQSPRRDCPLCSSAGRPDVLFGVSR